MPAGGQNPGDAGPHMDPGGGDPHHGEGEEQQRHQQIEDPLEQPRRQLGGKRDLLLDRDQVGPHELAGAAEQGDGGEADHGAETG